MNSIEQGRSHLQEWEHSKPTNFFTADRNLQAVIKRYLGTQAYAQIESNLQHLGAETATTIDTSAKLEDRIGNHPRLERWSALGERIEQIEFHPNHHLTGRIIWESGIMALQATPGNTVHQMGLYYLLGHNGEASHMCSLACTSGLIKALQQVADEPIRAQFLPPLLNPDYDAMQHGAQFLTEVQGGSDVGANAVTATPADDGTWRISGEKWFCSNINADQFLMTARASEQDGTRGLGLFLVPRLLDDGTTNHFHIRRLKDKLGTRTLASVELDFDGAVAYPLGAIERGFKHVVEYVLNTSRLMNAVACAGVMRRATIEAETYACHRQAFGQAIITYPMVQEAVVDCLAETYASTASSFYLAHLLDQIETGQATREDECIYRLLVNINKMITSITGSQIVHRAIEVLGGNGAIESFSILPRLYRDMVVLESWEGTHNVLCVQVLRDMQRYHLHEPFFARLHQQLATITHPDLQASRHHTQDALTRLEAMLASLLHMDDRYAQAHIRRWVDWCAYTAQATLLLVEAQWELEQSIKTVKPDICTYFINQHLVIGYDPLRDDSYLDRLDHLANAI